LGYAQSSNYCSTEVLHLNIPAETASAFNLTIVNTGATTMKVTAANADISFLDLIGSITGDPTKSDADNSVTGEISITLTWATAAPDDVTFQFIQWRKAGAATWQINDATTPFAGVCAVTPPEEDATLSDLQVDSVTLVDFSADKENYDFSLAEGTTVVPTITGATVNETGATTVITQATGIPGDATVVVTASGGVITKTYTVSFFIAPPTEPTTAAPIPTSLAEDVISVYSDTYTSIATNLNPDWGQATTVTEIDIAGNLAMKYANLNYQGLEYTSSDVSAMEYIHFDYYTVDATNFDFFLIAGGENAYDVDATDGITTGEWVSIDIPLSFFSDAGRDLTAAFQFKTVGNNNLFLDNIYFWKAPTVAGTDASLSDLTVDGTTIIGFAPLKTSYSIELAIGTTTVPTLVVTTTDGDATSVITNATSLPGDSTILITAQDGTTTSTVTVSFTLDPTPTVVAPTPTNLEADVISVYSDAYTSIATNLNPNWSQATAMTEIDINGNKFMEYANLNYQGLEYTSSDVSAMEYLHLDYYTSDATAFQLFLIAGGENAYDVAATDGITTGEWVGIDIPLSFFLDAGRDLAAAFQFKTVGDNTLYLDNIYFYKEATASVSGNELLNVTMYPNPTSSSLNISAQNIINSAAIYNILGKQVMSLEINKTSESIDVSNLSSGIYLIKYTVNNAVGTAKFIKE
jgi:hypothetical protein